MERLGAIHGARVSSRIQETMRAPKRVGYFVNPLVESDFEPFGEPVAGLDGCHAVAHGLRGNLIEDAAVGAGAVYPINPSSVIAVASLGVDDADEVLDLAAAPGGKTLLMAAAMDNRGRIAAVEPVKGRFHRLRGKSGAVWGRERSAVPGRWQDDRQKGPRSIRPGSAGCALLLGIEVPSGRSVDFRSLEAAQGAGMCPQAAWPHPVCLRGAQAGRGDALLHLRVRAGGERARRELSARTRAQRRPPAGHD